MTIQEKIIQKLDSDLYPDLNADMILKLTNESERGAVLIGTSKIEEYLEKFVLQILPQTSNAYTKRLTSYPGPLSSFSSKIELLYGFRYIGNKFYASLNKLRKIRNLAAHSYDDFNLADNATIISEMNEFEDDISYLVGELSLNNLLKFKKLKLERIYQEKGFKIDHDNIERTLSDFKTSDDGLKQHLIWQLSYGIVFMCLYVLVLMEENNYLEDRELTHPIK